MGRLISDILMESQLIDSLTDNQFSKGMQPLPGRILDDKALKNMRIITEVISPPVEFPKDIILNKMISLKDFPIFSKSYPLKEVVEFLEKCHVDSLLEASEAISQKKKRKTSKKHSERMTKKFKMSRKHRDTSIEEPRASKATYARTTSGTTSSSEAPRPTVDYSSSISTTTPSSSISIPHTSLQCSSLPLTTLSYNVPYVLEPIPFELIHTSAPQSSNPNMTITPPSPSISEILTSTIVSTPQPLLLIFLVSHLIQLEHP